jgi:hypothetical protein
VVVAVVRFQTTVEQVAQVVVGQVQSHQVQLLERLIQAVAVEVAVILQALSLLPLVALVL